MESITKMKIEEALTRIEEILLTIAEEACNENLPTPDNSKALICLLVPEVVMLDSVVKEKSDVRNYIKEEEAVGYVALTKNKEGHILVKSMGGTINRIKIQENKEWKTIETPMNLPIQNLPETWDEE